jgi:hypothetical protein
MEEIIMQMKQCPNGHFYDQSRTAECPYCTSASANVNVTRPVWSNGENEGTATSSVDIGATVPVNQPAFTDHTRSINVASAGDMERTQAVLKKEIGIDPVVGWLVCVEGKEKGRDYRIHSDNNFIGRSEKMDVCIRGDDTISRENHAIISYDVRDKMYYFSPGEGRSIVRVNGKAIFSTVEITTYDTIELGNTKLIFAPLCGEGFNWK